MGNNNSSNYSNNGNGNNSSSAKGSSSNDGSYHRYDDHNINVNNLKPKLRSIVHRLSYGLTHRRHSFDSSTSNSKGEGSQSSEFANSEFGWFEDFGTPEVINDFDNFDKTQLMKGSLQRALSLPHPVNEPPAYILEAKLETQQLWYSTAGRRPRQPEEERIYFERLWLENFKLSSVNYLGKHGNANNNTSNVEEKENIGNNVQYPNKEDIKILLGLTMPDEEEIRNEDVDIDILFKSKCQFSYAVSKSFNDGDINSITLQIPRYRVVRCQDNEIHAEFLVIVTLGSQQKITFGVWRRHSDFSKFATLLKDKESHVFKNSLLSWHCLVQRKRWFRCIEKDYLSLKCFLLERFLQDTLFESSTSVAISDFLGLTLP